MSLTISVTEDDYLVAARAFLLLILPNDCEVIVGQDNRVPEPTTPNFVVMTFANQQRMATNERTYDGGGGTVAIATSMQLSLQLDVHGRDSSTLAMIIAMAWRDPYGVDNTDHGVIVPLYCDDPHQAPFQNAEGQYESRWTLAVYLQAKPVLTTSQDYATSLAIQVEEADQ